MKIAMATGLSFLLASFIVSTCTHQALMSKVSDAHNLHSGIVSIAKVQEASRKFAGTLEKAGEVFKPKGTKEKYQQQMQEVQGALDKMQKEFSKFTSTTKYYEGASKALTDIDGLASKIFADDWSVSQFRSYMRSIKNHQKKFTEVLTEAALEMDRLIAEQFKEIGKNQSSPFTYSLLFTLLLMAVWAGLCWKVIPFKED